MRDPSPQFSVVIAAYNAARTLPMTLESLKRQTLSAFEAILVDDGSRDETPQIIASATAADPRFNSVRLENSGASAARNAGLERAAAPLVLFLDADDLLREDALERFCAHMAMSEAPAAFGGHVKIDDCGRVLKGGAPSKFRAAPAKEYPLRSRRSARRREQRGG